MAKPVHIIGGGLAGCEAAWQVARAGGRAVLYEMRPVRTTPAHKTGDLAELVCSNSLKSEQENTAPWLLKEELRKLGSLLIGDIAPRTRVPAGHALTRRSRFVRGRDHADTRSRTRRSKFAARRSQRSIPNKSRSSPAGRSLRMRSPRKSRASRAPGGCISTTASAPLSKRIQSIRRSRSGVALRQIARRDRRLSQLPVFERRVRGVSRCPARGRQRSGAYRAGPDALLRGVSAD